MLIPKESNIYIINHPISARYGIPTMYDMLTTDHLHVNWNGITPIVVVTLNASRTRCKLFAVNGTGCSCTIYKRVRGRFKHEFNINLLPTLISRKALERLLNGGSIRS